MTTGINYDALGDKGFRNLCHLVLREYLGPEYIPLVVGGADGGRDGYFEGTPARAPNLPGYWVPQFKHHDVASVGADKARQRFLGEVADELDKWKERATRGERLPDVLLFMTNVDVSPVPRAGTLDKINGLIAAAIPPMRKVLVWARAGIDTEISLLPEVRRVYCPTIADAIAAFTELHGDLLQKIAPLLSQPQPPPEAPMDVEVTVSAIYTDDRRAILVLADIGNASPTPLTIRDVKLVLPDIDTLLPDRPDRSLEATGYTWLNPHPHTIPGHGFERVGWYFHDRVGAKDHLDRAQPIRASLELGFFPQPRFLTRVIDLYSIRKLQEMANTTP